MTDTNEQTDEEIARNAREIELESVRIQKEMELERKARQPSLKPYNSSVKKELNFTCNGYGNGQEDNETDAEIKQKELSALDENIKGSRTDLKQLEKLIKDTREKAEDSRTQLMLTEFKRDNVMKELDQLTQELNVKRKKVKAFDTEVKAKMEEMKEFDSVGLTKEQVLSAIQERDVLESKCHNLEALQLERDELVRQLEMAKEHLFAEQKQARLLKDELEEEMESLQCKLEEIHGERDEMYQKLMALEMDCEKMKTEKDALIQDKTQMSKELKEKAKRESFDIQRQSARKTERQVIEIQDLNTEISQLRDGVNNRDNANMALRNQLDLVKGQVLHEHEAREALQMEQRRCLQNLRKETDTALIQVREACFLDKQHSLEMLREQLDREKKDCLLKCEDRMTKKLAELEKMTATKDDQIQNLEEEQQEVKEDCRQKIEKMKEESMEEVHMAIRKERQLLDQEREWLVRREREAVTADMARKLKSLTEDLEEKQKVVQKVKGEMDELKLEVESLREQNRQAVRDKLTAVARVKDLAQSERQADITRLKEIISQESKKEIAKLRESLQVQGGELKQLKLEKMTNMKKEREQSTALDRTERTLINEVNEECCRTASVLGLAPRKIDLSSFRSENSSPQRSPGPQVSGRRPTTCALANLRACNEELRNHVVEFKQTLDGQRAALIRAKREKVEAIDQVKEQLEREKRQEMDTLKERLIKEHREDVVKLLAEHGKDKQLQISLREKDNKLRQVQQNLSIWKEQVTTLFAKKFDEELEKRQSKHMRIQRDLERTTNGQQWEIERLEREVSRMAQTQNRNLSQSARSSHNRSGHHTRQRVKQAMTENGSLHHAKFTLSVPDLNDMSYYSNDSSIQMRPDMLHRDGLRQPDEGLTSAFDDRSRLTGRGDDFADMQARQADDLPHKMSNMNKLHSTLSQQSQELRQLERAYNQLQNHSYFRRSLSPPPMMAKRSPSPTFRAASPAPSTLRRQLSLSALR